MFFFKLKIETKLKIQKHFNELVRFLFVCFFIVKRFFLICTD
jgi:hypothetical protein